MVYKIESESDLKRLVSQMTDEQTAIVRYYSDIIFTIYKCSSGEWVLMTGMLTRYTSDDDMFWETVVRYLQMTSNNLTCVILDSYDEMAFCIRQSIITGCTRSLAKGGYDIASLRNEFEEYKGAHVQLPGDAHGYLVGLSSSDEDFYWIIYDVEKDEFQFHSCVGGFQKIGDDTCADSMYVKIMKKLYGHFSGKECLEVLLASI